jgi:hypothetical protein
VDPALLTVPERVDSTPLRRPVVPAPLDSRDIDRDSYSRWVGWKRFVRGRHVVPDTRGKDIDLVFTEDTICARIAGWLDDARSAAEDSPGEVLVVVAGDGLSPDRESITEAGALLMAQLDEGRRRDARPARS